MTDAGRQVTRVQFWLLALELLLWAAPAFTFLNAYVRTYQEPVSAVVPHLSVLGTFWCSLACIRVALWRALPGMLAGALNALLTGWAFVLVLGYYYITLLGLQTWGRVITWDLIATYSRQATHLVSALGIDAWWLAMGACVLLGGAPMALGHFA